jgi:hypothetical protein
MRLFDAQRELPAFPGVQDWRCGLLVEKCAEVNVSRHAGLRRERLFHIETEVLTTFVVARQLRDDADHLDVATLPLIRHCNGEALLGLPCGVIETESTSESGDQYCACKAQN